MLNTLTVQLDAVQNSRIICPQGHSWGYKAQLGPP